MGLGQESGREGEVVSWQAGESACVRVAMSLPKALFAAIAQEFGREGLRFMTASVSLVHEGCGSGHITVDGADNDLRNALAIAWHGATGTISRPLRGITSRCELGDPR